MTANGILQIAIFCAIILALAVPVMLGAFPVASMNITWLQRRSETATVVQRHLGALKRAADAISADLAAKRSA